MILVDTSVWIDHLRTRNRKLVSLLDDDRVLVHPFIVGELACGAMRNRDQILGLLMALPMARDAHHEEVLSLVGRRRLFGRGIGWVDAHLLASAILSGARLFTLDKRLQRVAAALGVSA